MKMNRLLVGMLACLGTAAGLSAASPVSCPPEGDDVAAQPAHVQGHALAHQHLKDVIGHLAHLQADDGAGDHQLVLRFDDESGPVVSLDGLQLELNDLPNQLHNLALSVDASSLPALARGHALALVQPDSKAKTRVRSKSSKSDDGHNNVVIVQDDNTVSITTENGKVTSVERNGKKIPLDQVKKDGGHVKIQDDNGKTVFEFDMDDSGDAAAAQSGPHWQSTWGGLGASNAQGAPAIALQSEPPKAMIGVQLGEPDAMLLGHFGLEAGDATLVTGVYEDLPAGEAGIKPYDIIVAVDGNDHAGQAELREALRGKDAGDKVTLTIIHKGERKDVKVKLVKYDQETLEKSKLDAVDMNAFAVTQGGPNNVFVAPGIGAMRNFQGMDPDKARDFAEQWRKQAEEMAQKFRDDPNMKGFQLHLDHAPDAQPAPPPAPGGNERWQRLEERLDRLEKMIERMAERQHDSGGGGPKNR
jgi:hypothetical protein